MAAGCMLLPGVESRDRLNYAVRANRSASQLRLSRCSCLCSMLIDG
jgi:hypothetical protein